MEFEQLLKLIKTVSDSTLTSFSFEEGKTKISMEANQGQFITTTNIPSPMVIQQADCGEKVMDEDILVEGRVITSPLVGTFYTAPSEEAAPYVEVGSVVSKGHTLAIVEAMKLMNEIECECDGTIVEIYVENGVGVEYGQPLFRVL